MEKMKNIIESFYHFFTRGQLTTHSTKISSIIVLCFCVPFELFTNFNLGLGTNCCVNKGIKVNVLMKKKHKIKQFKRKRNLKHPTINVRKYLKL